MTRIWGIHMPVWVNDDPVDTGRAYIGWPRVGDILQIPGNREAYKDAVARAYPDKKWTCNGFVPVTYFTMPPWPRMRAG